MLLAADPIVSVDTNVGNFKLDLFASSAPKTVANFLKYVDSGDYNNSFVTRSMPGFVIQGGGATTSSPTFGGDSSQFSAVPNLGTIPSEAGLKNTVGTIAMALSNGPATGTNQWFINLAANTGLDDTSHGGPFTVFGQVVGNGMQVINQIAALPTKSVNSTVPSVGLSNLPVSSTNQLVVISSMTVDSIDGTVFADANGNGTMDSGEAGVAGRTVFLDVDGTHVPGGKNLQTTTDANGNYSFSGLAAGAYTVREVLPVGLKLSTPNHTVVVAADQTNSGVNFGETGTAIPAGSIADSSVTFTATQGTAFTGTVATFLDPVTTDTAAGFSATINWGDGASTAGTINGSSGTFTVVGSHTYAIDGTDTVSVAITQASPGTASATATSTANVLSDLTGAGVTTAAAQGTPFTGTVATFTDPATTDPASKFTATIDWGDGSTADAQGTVTGANGTFTVAGTHTYAFGENFPVSVQVSDNTASSTPAITVNSQIAVPNTDTLSATAGAAISATEGQTPRRILATFSDSNHATPSTDFTATINWGDGSSTTAGTVSGSSGQFTVTSNRAFLDEGTFTVSVTIATNAASGPTASPPATTATVADGDALSAQAATFQATEGVTFTGAVATFSDTNTAASAADFTANIDWGDGINSVGTVGGSAGNFTVLGIHPYAQDGAQSVKVTLTDTDGTANATASSTADILSAGLTVTAVSVSAIEGQTFAGTMATFTDQSTGDTAAQFSATVNWGDGTSSTGTVSGSGGTFTVAATHAYADEGGFKVTIQVADTKSVPAVTASASASATVAEADVLTGTGSTLAATAGQAFSGAVATFSDGNIAAAAGDFTATIQWGDGSSSTGTVTGSAGKFTVSGSHTYAAAGSEALSVTLADDPAGTAATATAVAASTVQVAKSPLAATPGKTVTVTQGLSTGNVTVATFTDLNAADTNASFTATIDWGDGSVADSQATVSGGSGTFTVSGSHTYLDPGHYALTVAIAGTAHPTAVVNPTAVIGSGNERFIGQLYRDLLAREAEALGYVYWTNLMSQGMTRDAVVLGFEGSLEFRNDTAGELYQHYLGRAAEATSLANVAGALVSGTPEQQAKMLASSDEYFNHRGGGTANGFLTAIYSDILNRPVDSQAEATFGAMNLNDKTVRAQVVAQLFGTSEYQTDLINSPGQTTQKYNEAVPRGFFQIYLHRAADSTGLAASQAQFKAGQTDLQVMQQIIASDEYFAHL